ncbi:MAG: nuclear transport factor 2 family protein [Myxococcales bacterium]|nr:nuclear transport factor 2 family protein [Myxococcales bacterium]
MSEEHPARQAGLASQRLVLAGEREAWLALFADDAIIQDPVGISPLDPSGEGHRGKEAIAKFYDTVIAGGKVRFEVDKSYACGDECAFVGEITTTERPGLPRTVVDLVAVYRVGKDGKLASLRAFWEFDALLEKLQASPAS